MQAWLVIKTRTYYLLQKHDRGHFLHAETCPQRQFVSIQYCAKVLHTLHLKNIYLVLFIVFCKSVPVEKSKFEISKC